MDRGNNNKHIMRPLHNKHIITDLDFMLIILYICYDQVIEVARVSSN